MPAVVAEKRAARLGAMRAQKPMTIAATTVTKEVMVASVSEFSI